MEQNMLTWEIIAYGRVQGVGFRRYAYRCARLCQVRGYARNLSDGTVRILAQGEPSRLSEFCEMLRLGDRHILVQSLEINEVNNAVEYNDFDVC